MARARELTWMKGTAGRSGRWRKKYRGKFYYFPGGRGKSDDSAYRAALTEWQATKARIDAEAPTKHYPAYLAAIREWEDVLAAARQYSDEVMESRAIEKLQLLRKDAQLRLRRPPKREDLFENQFELGVVNPQLLAALQEVGRFCDRYSFQADGDAGNSAVARAQTPQGPDEWITPSDNSIPGTDLLKAQAAVWQDRLNHIRSQAVAEELTVRAKLAAFLSEQDTKVATGGLATGRRHTIENQLGHFADWLGGSRGIEEITGQKLLEYRKRLLDEVGAGTWQLSTASDRLGTVKSFVRWLWRTDAIPALPRIMAAGCKELEIGKSRSAITTFSKEEVASLVKAASPRTQLYILLTLNTAMTQKDIAELTFAEVDWQAGRITRKRSKTGRFDSVPMVSYQLWPETLALLKAERHASGKGRVLRNRNGSPLWSEGLNAAGNYAKIDNIRSVFDRLRNRLKITKPFKSLKKTSSSLLAGNKHYSSVRSLFLGHAPSSIADRHYAAAPIDLLDEALGWLRTELDIPGTIGRVEATKSPKKAASRSKRGGAMRS